MGVTNGDRIRQMSNEELADMLNGHCEFCVCAMQLGPTCETSCGTGIKAYLDMEVAND